MDDNDAVFLVTELWLIPGTFDKLKSYRQRVNELLAPYNPEYIFHNHAFEWVYGADGEQYPTGIQVVRFECEEVARTALADLDRDELRAMENQIFSRIRSYMSRYAFPDELGREMGLQS